MSDDPKRLLTAAQVRERLGGVTRMTLWRYVRNVPDFPRPIYLSTGEVKRPYFREAELEAYIEAGREDDRGNAKVGARLTESRAR